MAYWQSFLKFSVENVSFCPKGTENFLWEQAEFVRDSNNHCRDFWSWIIILLFLIYNLIISIWNSIYKQIVIEFSTHWNHESELSIFSCLSFDSWIKEQKTNESVTNWINWKLWFFVWIRIFLALDLFFLLFSFSFSCNSESQSQLLTILAGHCNYKKNHYWFQLFCNYFDLLSGRACLTLWF